MSALKVNVEAELSSCRNATCRRLKQRRRRRTSGQGQRDSLGSHSGYYELTVWMILFGTIKTLNVTITDGYSYGFKKKAFTIKYELTLESLKKITFAFDYQMKSQQFTTACSRTQFLDGNV